MADGIRVEQQYIAPFRGSNARIVASRKASVFRQRNSANVREFFAQERQAVVGGGIIHHDNLGARPPLGASGRQRTETSASRLATFQLRTTMLKSGVPD